MFKSKFLLFALVCIFASVFLLGCTSNNPVACTEEAKVCPDSSAVGRVAPDCNFAPCPELNLDYNFVEKERVVKIINSLQWVCVGKYCSGEEDVSGDVIINGKIKIDLIDINNPCENNDCWFNGFEIKLPTSYVGEIKKVFIDSNQSLIIENVILRFSKNTYDTHPGPYNSTYSISVYPQKNTLCSGYLCQKNSICYGTFEAQCMACGEMDQSNVLVKMKKEFFQI